MASTRWYRLIVTCDDASEVLLSRDGAVYKLPSAKVEYGERLAEAASRAGKAVCGGDLLYLFSGPLSPSLEEGLKDYSYCVLEHFGAKNEPCVLHQWVTRTTLSAECFENSRDYEAVIEALHSARQTLSDSDIGWFARLGWWKQISRWIAEAIRPLGYQVTGTRQLNGGPRFVLLRVATDGPAFWFKAVGEPNIKEFLITQALADSLPASAPQIIASLPECNGWLAAEVPGPSLAQADLDQWVSAASSLAELQMASIEHFDILRQAGARNLNFDVLRAAIGPCMSEVTHVMRRQEKSSPAPLDDHAIQELGEQLSLGLREITALDMPYALGNLDLNPANIITSPTGSTFLDWCEAYVGNPFFSFQYLLEHFRRQHGSDQAPTLLFEEAYWNGWRRVLPSATLDTARRIMPLLAVFAYTVALSSTQGNSSARPDSQQAYFRSLARRMKLETDRLVVGRSLCPVS